MTHPYRSIPDAQRWSRAMAGRADADIYPVSPPPFRIAANARVVCAGSCFAQHVARHLRDQGHAPFETEPAHPLLSPALAQRYNYGIYSARYGNIYTARQLLQLWRRATGSFAPADDVWQAADGWYDPFRPTIQPCGFSSLREYEEDRRQHLEAVHRAFAQIDVFIFTLGLTECWADRHDGAVYPLCPGVAAGTFDADRHVLLNFSVEEVVADMRDFISEVRRANPSTRMILTVSPVPLAATAESKHVLAATTYSKAVLRVAAELLSRLPDVYYFPSYEIVMSGGPGYLAADRRSVFKHGVGHVMALFSKHLLEASSKPSSSPPHDDFLERGQAIVDTLCDEELLDA